ncbi:uncharacterized protein LOC117285897 [Fukomys damarensis]|uniref:uncharacterized protein LOC117285897 n=1 Tax=Fukomys damarensis TaxID=885580 RepID=UPI0014557A10|nr:uncharacterized protein LOC117285897 [Fukomys damarensis]
MGQSPGNSASSSPSSAPTDGGPPGPLWAPDSPTRLQPVSRTPLTRPGCCRHHSPVCYSNVCLTGLSKQECSPDGEEPDKQEVGEQRKRKRPPPCVKVLPTNSTVPDLITEAVKARPLGQRSRADPCPLCSVTLRRAPPGNTPSARRGTLRYLSLTAVRSDKGATGACPPRASSPTPAPPESPDMEAKTEFTVTRRLGSHSTPGPQ